MHKYHNAVQLAFTIKTCVLCVIYVSFVAGKFSSSANQKNVENTYRKDNHGNTVHRKGYWTEAWKKSFKLLQK